MNRHPTSNYGDPPPGYLDDETSSFLSDPESPIHTSRLNGGTMRLLPTSGDGADDMNSSGRPPSPSRYNYEPDYDHSPYVFPDLTDATFIPFHIPMVPLATEPHSHPTLSHCLPEAGGKLVPG